MKAMSAGEAKSQAVRALGLGDSALGLGSSEVLACSLRRVAGFLCPSPRKTLVDAVHESVMGLLEIENDELRTLLSDLLESLIGHGDLLELDNLSQADEDALLVFRAPPSFVKRPSGTILLLGVPPDGVSPLPGGLQDKIEHRRHVRFLSPSEGNGEKLLNELLDLGLIEIPLQTWSRTPALTSAVQRLQAMQEELSGQPPCGEVEGLTILDWKEPVEYYRGRWCEPNQSHTGYFLGRRPRAYGADLWCYIELDDGVPVKLLDITPGKAGRACDYAWHLQAAIDFQRGSPQICEIGSIADDTARICFFSPVPQWARRRWSAIGIPTARRRALFCYDIPNVELSEERRFIENELWLKVLP